MHPNAVRIQAELRALGTVAEVITVPESTRTAAEAAATLGTDVGQIVKSLVFVAEEGAVLILTSGSQRVSVGKVRGVIGADIRRADADAVKRLTGYAIGGVPPIGHATPSRVLMDPHLLDFEIVWAAAGAPYAVFGIAPSELHRITGAQLVDITE